MLHRGKRCTREWDQEEKVTEDNKLLVDRDPYYRVVRALAEERLEQFADRVKARIMQGREEKELTPERVLRQQQTYRKFVQRNCQPCQEFLNKSGLDAVYSLEQLADTAFDTHISCNAQLQMTDAQLKKDAQRMSAFVNMLHEDMPFECALVTHFDWVERNLFGLQ